MVFLVLVVILVLVQAGSVVIRVTVRVVLVGTVGLVVIQDIQVLVRVDSVVIQV